MSTKSTAPLVELTDVWRSLRDRMLASASILVVGHDPGQAGRIAAFLTAAGYTAQGTAELAVGKSAAAALPPDLRLVTFLGSDDPRAALLSPRERNLAHPAVAVLAAPEPAAEALRAGADDVMVAPLAPERVLARVRARLRQAVMLRLMDLLSSQLGETARRAGAPRAPAPRTARRAGGPRALVATADEAVAARASALVELLGLKAIGAADGEGVAAVAAVAGVDVAVVDAALPGGAAEAVTALRAADPHVQAAVLDADGHETEADEALGRGAVTAIDAALLADQAVSALLARLLGARDRLTQQEFMVVDLARRVPGLLERWQAHLVVASPGDRPRAAEAASNRRQDRRAVAEVPVFVAPTDPPGEPVVGATTNLSLGGAFIACPVAVAPGTRVECRVTLEGTGVLLNGTVVRVGDGSSAEGRLVPGFAVQFDAADARTLRKLVEVVRRAARHG